MKFYSIFLFVIILFCNNAFSQLGCTDPLANNYEAAAAMNDGSCAYSTTNYSLTEIAVLPDLINESSGLVFFDDQLWTHNDKGGEDKIYQIDTSTGVVIQTVVIAAADNDDWEDLAQDENHIYIGDFGNNHGDRMNLKIYKIKKSELATGVATAEKIKFSYSDQTDFTSAEHATNYDCEAFFYHNDSLHLFSKNWLNQKTRHYVLPNTPGEYVAELRDSLDVDMLVTAADIDESGVVVLLGYNVVFNFIWILWDYEGTDFFSGNKRKISLGLTLDNSQTEGITFREGGYGYISSENLADIDPRLAAFSVNEWTNGISVSSDFPFANELLFAVSPNPFSDQIYLSTKNIDQNADYEISLLDVFGRTLKTTQWKGGHSFSWDLNGLQAVPGFYFLKIKSLSPGANEGRVAVFQLIKN